MLGQKFKVDAALSCNLRRAGCTDDLEETVNYAEVYRCGCCRVQAAELQMLMQQANKQPCVSQIKSIVEGEPCKLVEAVAERIADTILESQSIVTQVHIRIQKPHVAVDGVLDFLGVLSHS